jgi:mono/diheme cytochrome c family protein
MRTALPMLVGLGLLAAAPISARADGAATLKSQCSSCHALTKPADTSIDALWEKKAPDLYYAGVKFNRDWLVQWLQDPKPIRPVAYPYFKNVIPGKDHDVADPAKVQPHMKLSKPDAEATADALMALKPDGVVEKDAYKKSKVNMHMAALVFEKFRGCGACHEGVGGAGGFSGPELTDAGKRLQPDFIASYIKDPQKINPHVWMPTLKMNDKQIQQLTGYLIEIGEGEKK